ncbi:Iron import ATP-binding/permease protein IrtA [Slackia heliotrinireducens]|nr:Iron import ATP-binding/permease protein IrtA [Slackia heliotrinireducens]
MFDEATAFADPENEARIQKSVASLSQGKTLLVIAHRLSTIVQADVICVVDDGRIVARGTHEQLLEECALYRDMWQAHIGAANWAAGSNDAYGADALDGQEKLLEATPASDRKGGDVR